MADTQAWLWTEGDRGRRLELRRLCPCGCDSRAGFPGVGYLTASDQEGSGFSLPILDESSFEALARFVPVEPTPLHAVVTSEKC